MSDLLYVNALVDRALKTVRALSNKQSANEGDKQDALELLNEILREISGDGAILPIQVKVDMTLTAGERQYTIGTVDGATVSTTPFAIIEYVDISISGVRYSVVIQDDFAILGHPMNMQAESRPGWVRVRRDADANILEFYNLPDQNYACEVWGKKESNTVALQDYIALPDWYARYLRLALARELNDYFNLSAWGDAQEKRYLEAEAKMLAVAKPDWTIKSLPPFSPGIGIRTYNLGVRR